MIKKKTPKREAEKQATSRRVVKESSPMSAAKKNDLPDSSFAFASERKKPLIDAPHVRNAVARFMQVKDVSDVERDRRGAVSEPPPRRMGSRFLKKVGARTHPPVQIQRTLTPHPS
jgi:hypothetical protein